MFVFCVFVCLCVQLEVTAHRDGVGLHLQNSLSGSFSQAMLPVISQPGEFVTWVTAADMDGDGWIDVRTTYYNHAPLSPPPSSPVIALVNRLRHLRVG